MQLLRLMCIAALAMASASCSKNVKTAVIPGEEQFPSPPAAIADPDTFHEFGQVRVDNYFWLKDKTNPEVIAYLEAENSYCDTVMFCTKDLQEILFEEMKGRIKEEDQTVPVADNGYYYYTRTLKDKQYPVYCRKQGDTAAEEEVIFDVNGMAEGHKAFIFAGYSVSEDNRLAAYASNTTGSSVLFNLKIRDLNTGNDLEEFIPEISSFVWANDNRTLFYTTLTPALRPDRVYRHTVGSSDPDQLVFEEPDELFNVDLTKSRTKAWIFISSSSFNTSEYRMIPAADPLEQPIVFLPRVKDVDYEVQHHDSCFYVRYKTRDLLNGKIFKMPLTGYCDSTTWETVVEHDQAVKIQGYAVYHKFVGLFVRTGGLNEIRIFYPASAETHTVTFPEPVYAVFPSPGPEYHSSSFRYNYSSLNRPQTIYDFDINAKTSMVLKEQEIPGGFNPAEYRVERMWGTSADGVKVPMAVVYKKSLKRDRSNPALLEGYGSYGNSTDATFRVNIFSLVDRGYVYGIAQVRGGSELGEQWYEDGRMMNKKNSFNDFVACAENLLVQGLTSPSLLGIRGGSAGGLLMGAVVNLRPDLFNVVIADVPFVDVLNTMLDESLPLTTQEYEQWGNPHEKEAYDYIKSYSPYDNLQPAVYPNILATAGLNDSQVSYHEPAKWVARLRTLKTGNNIVLLKTNMESGHGGATGRYDYLKELAFRYAFLIGRNGK